MILSLEIFPEKKLHVYSFFPVKNSISVPAELWFKSLSASLKNKQSVLILEENLPSLPAIDETKRWIASDNWCWLSPRSLSVISEVYLAKAMTFHEFKTFLISSK